MSKFGFSFISFLLILNGICFSQAKVEWEKKYGEKDFRYFSNSIIQTRDSGYILIGGRSKSLLNNEMLVVKLSPNGDLVWEKTYGIYSSTRGNSIIQLKDGGYALTGFKRLKNRGDFIWLIKTDSLGNILWEKTFGNGLWNEGMVLKTNQAGEIILGGVMTSTIYKTQNVFLAKFNSDGTEIWKKLYERNNFEIVEDINIDEDGTIYATGLEKIKNYKPFLKKINEFGEITDEFSYNYSKSSLRAYGLLTSDNLFFMLGDKLDQKRDFLLLKMNLDGRVISTYTIGTKKEDFPFGLVELSSDKFILVGSSNSGRNGGVDGWVVAMDRSGKKLWDIFLGGKKNDGILSIAKTNDNGFVVSGYTNSGCVGTQDLWIVKLK